MNKSVFATILLLFIFSLTKINAQENEHNDIQRTGDMARYQYSHAEMWGNRNGDTIRNTLHNIKVRLKSLGMNFDKRLSDHDRQVIHVQIADILNMLDKLYPEEEVNRHEPMTEIAFNDFYATLSREPFARGKQQIIMAAARWNYFTIDQLIRVLAQFSLDDNKLNVVKALYPKVTDRDYQLYNCFTFPSAKIKLGDYLNSFRE